MTPKSAPGKPRAIISDIHGNLEALETVLSDIRSRGIEEIICLGDMIGYGPNPEECLDLVARHCRLTLQGNHDYALMNEHDSFSAMAEQSLECTREIMLKRCLNVRRTVLRLAFLRELPQRIKEGRVLYVHASPRDPITEYLTEADLEDGPSGKIMENLRRVDHLCFVGHTHVPGIITDDFRFLKPIEDESRFLITERKMIVNTGAVGQPRDGDPRACYCEVSASEIIYHRLPYNYRLTQKKIIGMGCLHSACAERLEFGI